MFCMKCGTKLPDGANYCGKCGCSINGLPHKDEGGYQSTPVNNINIKNLVINIIFVVLVIVTVAISRSELIDFNGELFMMEFTLGKFVDYVKTYSEWIEEVNTGLLTAALWFIGMGSLLHIIAAFRIFFNTDSAHVFTVTGTILNIFALILYVLGCMQMVEGAELGSILAMFADITWLYVILNIAMVIISTGILYSNGIEYTYAGKSYDFYSKLNKDVKRNDVRRNDGDWNCPECGKINSASIKICSCGTEKSIDHY